MADSASGPSGGVLGTHRGLISQQLLDEHPDLAREIVTAGRYRRAGHDRARWVSVNWDDYRARVGVGQSLGKWRIDAIESRAGDVTNWVAEAEGMPVTPPGWYTSLEHADRGLVMCDLPAEAAGMLPFLDAAARLHEGRVLIAGLGLGIVPAWLIANTTLARIDVIEIDPDVIELITRGRQERFAPNSWAADPRLHIHQGDAHTWWPPPGDLVGCALHGACELPERTEWLAGFFDIWDTTSPRNLPSMHRLTRHYARRVYQMWSWERAECEAMRRRGQTLERPYCFISETGYPAIDPPEVPGDR